MNQMLKTGDVVTLVRDRSQDNRDVYDRLLRYVELKGKDLGRKQVSKGWAEVMSSTGPSIAWTATGESRAGPVAGTAASGACVPATSRPDADP